MKNKVFVGYDTREDIAYQVCEHSLKRFNTETEVIPLIQKDLRDQKLYWREVDKLASTEFTFTRFLIPHLCNYKGWALFCDSDVVFLENVDNLFALADDKYAVMCVQHDYAKARHQDGRTSANCLSKKELEFCGFMELWTS